MEELEHSLPNLKFYSILSSSFYDDFIGRVKFFDSIFFFSLNQIKCMDQIYESFRRSKNVSKCKIKERGAYFLCLLSGSPRIDSAIEKSGLHRDTKIFGIVSENSEEIEHFENMFASSIATVHVNLKERCDREDMKIFSAMTMVDYQLHSA